MSGPSPLLPVLLLAIILATVYHVDGSFQGNNRFPVRCGRERKPKSSVPHVSSTNEASEDDLPVFQTPNYGKINQPSKSDIYSSDELLGILDLHTNLASAIPEMGTAVKDSVAAPSLRELIQQNLQDIDSENVKSSSDPLLRRDMAPQKPSLQPLQFESSLDASDFRRILPNIRAIASDVDGTLLSSDHTLHPMTRQAIKNALEAAFSPMHPLQVFFPATGKTRRGALNSLGPEMQVLLSQVPGVYVQGLYCVDASGRVVFEKKLSSIAVEQAMALAKRCGVSLIAYDGDMLFATDSADASHLHDVSARWGEPQPQVLDDASVANYKPGFHKVLLMGDTADQMSDVRPQLEVLATSLDCVVTQAIPIMLELLPSGCSKAVGVQKLCEHLGLDLSTNVCAMGDAENDLDLLRLAAIGVAVGNAAPAVKEIADVVLTETNNDGGAGRAIELFGLGKVLEMLDSTDNTY